MEIIRNYQDFPIKDEEIEELGKEIKRLYNENLKQYGLSFPKEKTNKWYYLIYLYKYMGRVVHKDVVSEFVRKHNPDAAPDQQVRHLCSQFHYNTLITKMDYNGEKIPSGCIVLIDLISPASNFVVEQDKRKELLNTNDFEVIKKNYD